MEMELLCKRTEVCRECFDVLVAVKRQLIRADLEFVQFSLFNHQRRNFLWRTVNRPAILHNMNGQTTYPPNSVATKNELKHPLQRLHSPSRTFSLILHLVGLYSFAKSFEYLQEHPNPINQSYGWHFQYLTILGMPHVLLRG